MHCGEGILGPSQTLWGVLATLLVLCIFSNSSSNFIVELARKIIFAGKLNLPDYGEILLNRFNALENYVNTLKDENPKANEINEVADLLIIDIQNKKVKTQIMFVPYDRRVYNLHTQLENGECKPTSYALYIFLYSLVILFCDAIPGMTHLFVFCFSLLSAVFYVSPWFCKSSIGGILKKTIIFWISVAAFAIGQIFYSIIEADNLLAYSCITILPVLLILCSILSWLYYNLMIIRYPSKEEFVTLSMLITVLLSLIITGCYHLQSQESVAYNLLCSSITLFRVGIVIFLFTIGIIIPVFTLLTYSFTISKILYDKIAAISLHNLKQHITHLNERYATLPKTNQ